MQLELENNDITDEGARLYDTMLKTIQVRLCLAFSTITIRLPPTTGDHKAESGMG